MRVAIAAALSPDAPRRRGDHRHDQRRVAHGRERHEDRAAVGLLGQEPGELDREACLPGAAGTDDREHARVAVEPEGGGLEELALAAEEVGRRSGKVDGTRRAQRRELHHSELEQLGGSIEVLEPVTAEVLSGSSSTSAAVAAERSTWPPWASAATRAPRWTSIPT